MNASPDRRTSLRLTRRGRIVRAALLAIAAAAFVGAVLWATHGTIVTWDGLVAVPVGR